MTSEFTIELTMLYSSIIAEMARIEETIVERLPALILRATKEDLKAGLTKHLEETKKHMKDMQQISSREKQKGARSLSKSFEILMDEVDQSLQTLGEEAVVDACIIAAASTVEHIEMSKYEALINWAKVLEDSTAQEVFEKIYASEKASAEALLTIGKGTMFNTEVNMQAAEEIQLHEERAEKDGAA